MKILVSGSCGFIGTNLCLKLCKNKNYQIYGIDNFIDNYDVNFKKENYNELIKLENFTFYEKDIGQSGNFIKQISPDIIIHLASTPGVRKSLTHPIDYLKNNVESFISLLEECKKYKIPKVIYASSSSVYGSNQKIPFNELDDINNIQSSYACSKKCMETYAQYYNDVFGIKTIGLRFFTVYGKRGRPDMAPYKFVKNIAEDQEIVQYGDGSSYRDYTYVDDIVSGIISIVNGNGVWGGVYNLGNETPITLKEMIKISQEITGKQAKIKIIENQLGDVPRTIADITKAKRDLNYSPKTDLRTGFAKMFKWMKKNNRIN